MNIEELRETLVKVIEQNKTVSFITSQPGIGKSALIKSIANEYDIGFIDLRLSQYEAVDFIGCPVIEGGYIQVALNDIKSLVGDLISNLTGTKKKVVNLSANDKLTRYYPPAFLPHDKNSAGILFLDEFNSATESVQKVAYQLLWDRRIGDYELPDDWIVILAGNRDNDLAIVNKISSALETRVTTINLDADLECWKNWAYKNNIHPSIIGFVTFREDLFCKPPNKVEKKFPCPRTWEFVNNHLQLDLPAKLERELIEGAIGPSTTIEFVAFKEVCNDKDFPKIEDILKGNPYVLPHNINVIYAVNASLTHHFIKKDKINNTDVNIILDYIDKIYCTEMKVSACIEFTRQAKIKFIGDGRSKENLAKWNKLVEEIGPYLPNN